MNLRRIEPYLLFKLCFPLNQHIESIEVRRGLLYHVRQDIVEMSNALPVEDRLVIFDAVRLSEPQQMDHHCVRYCGSNVCQNSVIRIRILGKGQFEYVWSNITPRTIADIFLRRP